MSTSSSLIRPSCNIPGLTDAAGNALDDTSTVHRRGDQGFVINFDIQPTPVYITNMAFESTYSANGSTVIGGPQSYYELPPAGGTNTRDNVPAPPTAVVIDFSNQLPYLANGYGNDVQLIGRPTRRRQADGDFGNLGEGGLGSYRPSSGFTVLSSDYTVTLYNYTYNAATGQFTSTLVQPGGRAIDSCCSSIRDSLSRLTTTGSTCPTSINEHGGVDTRV